MEHYNLDAEDFDMFRRSLQLLHSPHIGSQRKLYHLLNQSIRKHHPNSQTAFGQKSEKHQSSESSAETPVQGSIFCPDQPSEDHSQYDERCNKESKLVVTSAANSKSDPRYRVQSNVKLNVQSELIQASAVDQRPVTPVNNVHSHITSKNPYTARNVPASFKSSNIIQQNRVSIANPHDREQRHILRQLSQRPLTKSTARHNYSSCAVNLKKIRAVLARGDAFPTHLIKGCINNITPDLQREKL